MVVMAHAQTPATGPTVAAAPAAAPAAEAQVKGPRRIAVILPVTGEHHSTGVLLKQGYELGELVIRESVLKNAEVRYFDSGKSENIEALVKGDVAQWQPDVIVGPYTSEESLALSLVAKSLNIPVVTPAATIDKLNQDADGVVYRICPPQYKMAETAASFMESVWNDWGVDKVVILTEENPFGRQAAQSLVGSFATRTLVTPDVIAYLPGKISKAIDTLEITDSTVVMMLGRSTDDARKVVNKFEKTNRIVGVYGAFTTPEFRLYASAQASDVHKGLYVVSPWQSERSNKQIKDFDARFRNMHKDALDQAIPQSHSAQAYTAMLVAGHALADARDNNTDVFTALNTLILQSPLGEIKFIDYGGYHRQTTVAASVQQYQGTLPRVVYPLLAKKAVTAPAAKKERGAIRTLLENQLFAMFAILALGLGFGAISIRGISLGSSGVLFAALVFGHYGLTIPAKIGTLGLILFVYGVGLGAGPGFFRAFVSQGKNLAIMGMLLVCIGAICTVGCAKIFDIPADLSVGIFAGSMTSTPALAAAIDMLKDSGPLAPIGYGVAYPFGVVGVVLFVQLLPKMLGVDLDKLSTEISTQSSKSKMIMRVLVEITNPAVIGKHLVDLDFIAKSSCQLVRVKKDQRMIPVTPDLILEEGEKVLIVGKEENLQLVVEHLGKRSDEPFFMDADRERRTVVVTSSAVVGRSLRGLDLLRKHGVSVSRIVRNDASFVPNADTIIQRADALTVVGEPENMEAFADMAGHRAKALEQTDILSLSIGIALGIILGQMPFGLGTGASFALGMTGGPLFVSLILGHFGRLGFLSGYMPRASRLFMTELGLVFFLMGAGVKAGGAFVEVVQEHGIKLFIMGVIVTALPMAFGYPIARKVLKLNLLQTLGGTCGGMTSTPGLGAITAKTDSDIPVVSYATAYPVALILMTIFAQLVISLLS
jgi:putative transport protein